jgi:hypothetical protein
MGPSNSSYDVVASKISDIVRVIPLLMYGSNTPSSKRLTLSEKDSDRTRRRECDSLPPVSVELGRPEFKLLREPEYVDLKLGPLNRKVAGDMTSRLGTDWYGVPAFDRVLEALDGPELGIKEDSRLGLWLKMDVRTLWKATRGLDCLNDASLTLRCSVFATLWKEW